MDFALGVQLVGLLAVAMSVSIFQINDRGRMLKLSMSAAVLYAVHFFLLGARTGAAMNLIGAARSYTYFEIEPSKSRSWIPWVFLCIGILGTIITWKGPISLLPLFGSVSTGVAFWHTNTRSIRRWALIASPLWFIYNAISGSYPGMLIEVIMLSSNLLGEYRFDFRTRIHARIKLARPA